MKLRSLTLFGFKSFAERTELHFHDGITAIVGPNGCGKSNISDAIRWVLGEQRPSAIRGSRMEEAIFQGTVQRRPLNRAEVLLTFSNEEGRLALPHRDVEIRRTVFREGGSDYHLNRQPTRLRDILDLCRDTGLGANAYTVIEQGMVDAILSDRAEERRHLFEEAAGVGRYKDRRKAAQRRLEAAEADLARLQDLIVEVESKVRSLARQRRRAQRYVELRARRLDLEVALAKADLERILAELARTTERLEHLSRDDPATRAELTTAEAELERCRLESGELARQRGRLAGSLEDVAKRIASRERELAVAQERAAHAERRLVQIARDRDEIRERVSAHETEIARLEAERDGQRRIVEALASRVAEAQERNAEMRAAVTTVRRADEDARAEETALMRQLAALEADAARAMARAGEAEAQLRRLADERSGLRAEVRRLDEQRDLFAEQAKSLAARKQELATRRAALDRELAARNAEDQEARSRLATAEQSASRLSAQVEALERLEREFHGFAPAVAAALAARSELEGLLGPVADLVGLTGERGAAVETALGPLLQALVVQDERAMSLLRAWIDANHPDKGAVALLPRGALPRLEALLAEMQFAGQRATEPVLVGRRERLAALQVKAGEAGEAVARSLADRAAASDRVAATEAELRELLAALHEIELELRRSAADETTREGHRGITERALGELERRESDLNTERATALAAAEAARASHVDLEASLSAHRAAWVELTRSLGEREVAWETVRDEEAEIRVAHARAEGALSALERRITAGSGELQELRARMAALDTEEAEHRASLAELDEVGTVAGAELEEAFGQRDTLAAEVRGLDDRLASAADSVLGLETRVRGLRRSADETSELRHRLELARADALSSERRVRDRLEAEWNRPFEQLVEEASELVIDPDQATAELHALTADIERLGPINMLAMEEHEEESRRLEFLSTQRDDLVKARDDLQSAIRQINRTARELFTQTFEQIREKFQLTFVTLFEGGECDIRLEDPADPLETPIEITASPRGKRTQRIHLLSGGERALTALALLFAIYLVKPSPFCVLDEVDAPLDDANINRFVSMLQQFKASTQFIVITHNPRTMESADWLYGVTMEEPGISSIVGVHLDEVLAGAGTNGR